MAVQNEAFKIATVDARVALRRRDYAAVARLVARSRALTDSLNYGNAQAAEILAESYLDQGRYGDALGEIAQWKEDGLGDRLSMTIAAAYLGNGQPAEARKIVLRCYGWPAAPEGLTGVQKVLRSQYSIVELPMDADPSDRALAASVWLLRGASFSWLAEGPETLQDLNRALPLAPNSAQIHLALAKGYLKNNPLRAKAELDLAMAGGGVRYARFARPVYDQVAALLHPGG